MMYYDKCSTMLNHGNTEKCPFSSFEFMEYCDEKKAKKEPILCDDCNSEPYAKDLIRK